MRLVMRLESASVADGLSEKCRPVGTRDLNIMPGGWPAPIRSAIACSPRGVPREFLTLEGGRLEVETA